MNQPRPRTVTVVAGFLFAATGIALVTGTSLILPGTKLDALWRLNPEAYAAIAHHEAWKKSAGAGLIALGIATTYMGAGLLRGRRWAWRATVILFVVDGLGDLTAIAVGPHRVKGASGVLVTSAFLYAMTRRNVREFANSNGSRDKLSSGAADDAKRV